VFTRLIISHIIRSYKSANFTKGKGITNSIFLEKFPSMHIGEHHPSVASCFIAPGVDNIKPVAIHDTNTSQKSA
jgi:hypothetical protein